MDKLDNNKLSPLLGLLLGGVGLSFLGFIADISEIITSPWFERLISSKWIPYVLNILLSIFVIYLYRKLKAAYTKVDSSLASSKELLKSEVRLNCNLWKRYVRTLRSIVLEGIASPTIRDSLEPLLDELAKKLPNNGVDYKIGLVKPYTDGSFKFLAERGMDPASVHSMEQKSNWKERKSFFANGIYLPDDRPFRKYKSGEPTYSNIQRDQGIGTSISHFVVAIKAPVYPELTFPQNTIAVLSIGISKEYDFPEDQEPVFYDKIFPIVKSIEAMLLNRMTLDTRQN
ncbi:MAG: hypothetical protein WCF57_16630 [Pyrinomonadaceae bacterium]